MLTAFVCSRVGHAETHASPTAADLRIAAERFDEGRNAYKAGAYAEAAEHFEAADGRAPSASALGLAMRSRAEAAQTSRAASLAELVLLRYPDDAELVAAANAIIETAKPVTGRLAIECVPDCDLVVDERLIHGRAAPKWTVYLEPGAHLVAANWPSDRVASEGVELEAGGFKSLAFTLPPTPQAQPQSPLPRPSVAVHPTPSSVDSQSHRGKVLPPGWFWGGVAATAVLGGVAIWSGIDTRNNPGPDAVRRGCIGKWEDCDLYQEGQRKEVRTNVLFAATGLLAAATAVTGVFLTDFSSKHPAPAPRTSQIRVRPWVDTRSLSIIEGSRLQLGGSAILGAEGRF